jgi:predicted transcriptional regulator
LSYIVGKFIEKSQPIPVRDVTKELGLSASRTSQLITALEQYEIITTEMNRKLGSFRVITPDPQLVEKVAKKEITLPSY